MFAFVATLAIVGCKGSKEFQAEEKKAVDRVCSNTAETSIDNRIENGWGGVEDCTRVVVIMHEHEISIDSITRCWFANLPSFCGIRDGWEKPVVIWIFNSTERGFTKLNLTKEEAAKAAMERVE